MIKFIVQMVNALTKEVLNTEDEEFDTIDDAKRYSFQCMNDFSEGADVLEDSGREFTSPDDVEFIVKKVKRK